MRSMVEREPPLAVESRPVTPPPTANPTLTP